MAGRIQTHVCRGKSLILLQTLIKTGKILLQCPKCSIKFYWPTVRKKIKCPGCNLLSSMRFYARANKSNGNAA